VTAVPGILMLPVTMTAGYLNVVNNFLPKGLLLLTVLSIVMMGLMTIVFIQAFRTWYELLVGSEDTIVAAPEYAVVRVRED
jgi:carbon starvation protein